MHRKFFVINLEGKRRPIGNPRRRWTTGLCVLHVDDVLDGSKVNVKITDSRCQIHSVILSQYEVQLQTFVETVMNIHAP